MKEMLEEIERKWTMVNNENTLLRDELENVKEINADFLGKLDEKEKEYKKIETKWRELLKKIQGEMNDKN